MTYSYDMQMIDIVNIILMENVRMSGCGRKSAKKEREGERRKKVRQNGKEGRKENHAVHYCENILCCDGKG